MKTKRLLLITLSLALVAQMAFSVNSYSTIGRDCIGCHNEPLYTGYTEDMAAATGTVDGMGDDAVYGGDANRLYVPMSLGHEFEFARTTFGQNSTHIFVIVRVHDDDMDVEGTDSPYYGKGDKLAIMWNINASTININYAATMGGEFTGGEAADLWMWAPTAAESEAALPDNQNRTLVGSSYDGSLQGAVTADATNDLTAAGYYDRSLVRGSYAHDMYVEFARPLVTDDPQDVQFDHTGFYEFTMAIWNGSNSDTHAVSFSHFLYVVNGEAPSETVYETVVVTNEVDVTNEVEVTVEKTETPFYSAGIYFALASSAFIAIYKRRD